jgi:hypothetical protein
MNNASRKPRIGDVLELVVGAGFGYVQYLGRHSEYGDAIRVVPRMFSQHQSVAASLFEDAYITFYPVQASSANELSRIVGNLPAPQLPTQFRRAGLRAGTQVETWIIEDDRGETLVRELSVSELLLPIAAIWNHEYLVQRIDEGWTPARASQ